MNRVEFENLLVFLNRCTEIADNEKGGEEEQGRGKFGQKQGGSMVRSGAKNEG
jgi:hypothetical protein